MDSLSAQVEAMVSGFEQADDPMMLLIDAIRLRHTLHVAGRFDDERRLLLAAIAKDQPAALTARHRYYLAVLAIQEERFEDARQRLGEIDERVGDGISLPPDGYWRDHYLGERHYLEMGRADLFRAAGLLTKASVYRQRAQAAFEAYALNRGVDGREVPAARQAVRYLFDLDFELARMRNREALELADAALLAGDLSPANQFQIARRRAAALAQLALDEPEFVDRARAALATIAELSEDNDVVSAEDQFDACFRLVRLEARLGDTIEATRWCREAHRLSDLAVSTPLMRARELLVSMELDVSLADPSAPFDPDLDARWSAAMEARLAWWQRRDPRPGGTGTLHFDQADYVLDVGLRSGLRREEVGKRNSLRRLADVLRTSDFFRGLQQPAQDLSTQIDCLLPGEVALFMFSTTAGGHGFLASHGGRIDAFETGTANALQAACSHFRQLVSTPPTGNDAASRRHALAESQVGLVDALGLQSPAGAQPGSSILDCLFAADSVVVVASELAFDVPLEALARAKGESGSEVLGCVTCVSHVPCLDLLVALRSTEIEAQTRTPRVRVISDVPSASWVDPRGRGLGRVDVGVERARAWSRALGGDDRAELGRDGAVESLVDPAREREDVLVVFAHGDRVESMEQPSALLLGASGPGKPGMKWSADAAAGRLTAGAVEDMLGWNVVFLAACGAGSGPTAIGSGGGNHLGGAFLSTGARSVLLSQGDLPAAATAVMLDAWTQALGNGASVGEALRQARATVAGTPSMADPYFHAGLRLLGRPDVWLHRQGHPPANGRWMPRWTIALIGTVIVLLLIAAAKRP